LSLQQTTADPAALTPELTQREYPPAFLAWSIWGIAALFYLAGFYHRVSPAVMTDELMRAFNIGAGELGNLSAFYFYFYVAMQIPTGILVDSWGARKLLIAGSVTAAIGAFFFGSTHDFALACAGRAIIGGATAVGWLVLLKLATHWFPARRFAMLSGLGLCFGNIGALTAQVPLRLAIQHFGWRPVIFVSAAVVLLVGVLALIFVKDDPIDDDYLSYAPVAVQRSDVKMWELLKGFKSIFAYRNTWLIFFAQGGLVGSMIAFTGLWGAPFLRARYGLLPTQSAAVCSVMIVCWAVASPLCGALSDRIGRRKPIYVFGCIIAAAGWASMVYIEDLPLSSFIVIAALTSLCSGAVVLGFAFAKESVPAKFLGTISGTTNIGNMIGPMLLQPGIGCLVGRNWTGEMNQGVHIYGVHAYRMGFLLIVGWLILSSTLLSFTKETRCMQSA
jgi:MFS family permease